MRLNHNMSALNIYNAYCKNLSKQNAAMSRIHSGLKVATAKDDPNKLSSSEHMKIQIRSLEMASRNTQDTISMLQTADSASQNISDSLIRIKELTIQAGGTGSEEDKKIIQEEINSILEGIDDIAKNTEINGKKILSSDKGILVQCGSNAGEQTTIPTSDLSSSGLGLDGQIKVLTTEEINKSIDTINTAISKLNDCRSKMGAISNRLTSNTEMLNELSLKTQNAESSLTGADISEEIIEYTKNNVLVNAGLSLMVQANKLPQDVLNIIGNIGKK
ncbi:MULTISPECIES: flagellin [Clostridium]|uniref:Flagellin n=1 Tax=Clostridium senegalense TaxID=1465809 RepID=A0A6M0H086_9CLOT|nr:MULTISPECIES: flagellin [Clostridium]NEU03493.1 flagellin [Clostridium senegalense]